MIYKDEAENMGQEATDLLKRLEYRGYDSTGASFIDRDRKILVLKRVGAPSKVTGQLGIPKCKGQRFIGQVRWATYGAVTDTNSQPHHVRCKVELVGAHNGNISNTDSLKAVLTTRGHKVVSDNDGEIIVHLIEDHYAANRQDGQSALLAARQAWAAAQRDGTLPQDASPPADVVLLMIDAIRKAEAEAEGSYAAAVADPQVPGVFAVKAGSSLYAGIGHDQTGEFVVVSSDLTSVLTKTRSLIPLAEGQGIWYTENSYLIFSLHGGLTFSRPMPRRSKLDVRDIGLDSKYGYYMEQEIFSAPANAAEIIRYYFSNPELDNLALALEAGKTQVEAILDEVALCSDLADDAEFSAAFGRLLAKPEFSDLYKSIHASGKNAMLLEGIASRKFCSADAQLLLQADRLLPGHTAELALLDLAAWWRKNHGIRQAFGDWMAILKAAKAAGGRVYFIASGTSYHAALTAAAFFADLGGLPIYPCNPGLLRTAYLECLAPTDLVVAISQSGETKDLVDILQEIAERYPNIKRLSLVNNENSRIPQELSTLYLPLLCGPETAVAATKSFINQLVILYIMAASFRLPEVEIRSRVILIQDAMQRSLVACASAIDVVARRLYMKPSLHVLGTGQIGLAKEAALKIREVVLNHSEGYDTAEFKHGPNTILGRNTLFSFGEIERSLIWLVEQLKSGAVRLDDPKLVQSSLSNPALTDGLFTDYPLIFVCPPDQRAMKITISQIHTHKIRGAEIILFAEPNAELRLAATGRPAGNDDYHATCIDLPASGDSHRFVFSAAVAMQYLALRMSVHKKDYLDSHGIAEHGVHPDVPKNVSKSITVD
ncbi:MAG: hypothetical protein A2087_07325 [Spirochaetes bacterium GWD1_61_31]|nr:MAG: hypothetical protein A2Y37_08150 [Spirochaetes bacterium GWB1_60_80]OHD40151.1 MAG: hypothetical protein A2087_07325 [Spirochaetes bacterium GWD1_61_31]OHD45801.1 MAG: hypothetical protein A2Y35_03785 [Spirochaetes bacterium GWE1_60_18]